MSRNSVPLTIEKIPVFTPTPSAIVTIVATVKPGERASERAAGGRR
jgi:hypothetical protein